MIGNMNRDEFNAKLKELVCYADWHHRYYTQKARKYKRIDYWIKTLLGLIAVIGAFLTGTTRFRFLGACMAGGCAFILANILPNFRWDTIVSGFKDEQEEWTRIFHGYDGLLSMSQILDRDEMLAQEYQKIEELRKASELHDRNLPDDNKLLLKLQSEVRKYYELD
jgi:hypothetical protein